VRTVPPRDAHLLTKLICSGYILPTLKQLRGLHNFTIESQVQFYGPLGFEPPRATHSDGSEYYALGEDELKMFVNSADWSLGNAQINYHTSTVLTTA
jgi:hypothetical protein